jgi:hypothetical protein
MAASPAASSPEPPDGHWLTDERGREYFLRPIPKEEGVRVDAHTVRTIWRVPLEVVSEDDRFYYYKFYRPPTVPEPAPPAVPSASVEPVVPPSSSRLSFRPFGDGLPTAGQWRDGFALADMNADGQLDVVHGPPRKGARQPVVFLGDGRGTWRRWDEARFPALPFDYGDVQVADLDGDGLPDLAMAVHLRGVVALAGDGRGGFRDAGGGLDFARDGGVAPFSSRALRVADLDGDGRPDIVALGDGPRLAGGAQAAAATGAVVYSNRGAGTWRPGRSRAATGLFGGSLSLADFDGDGRPDLATASSVLGRRDIVQLARPDGAWEPVTLTELPPHAVVRAVAAGDLDDDGRADLAVAYSAFDGAGWRSGVDLFRPGESGWRRQPIADWAGATGLSALSVGDVDGDRHPDVVGLGASGETWIFLADGGGAFTREQGPPPYGPGCRGSHVEIADLDADGRGEIVAAFAHEPAPAVCPSGGGVTVWKAAPS